MSNSHIHPLFQSILEPVANMRTRPFYCENHPDDPEKRFYACREHQGKWICWECFKALPETPKRPAVYGENANRAYATGLGPQAHYEAQEAGRLQREYEEAMPMNENRKRSIWK